MSDDYKIVSMLVCDDVRTEHNGKEILIGVYNDDLISPKFPIKLPKLVVRISVRMKRDNFSKWRFMIKLPDDKTLLDNTQDIGTQSTTEATIFHIQLAGPPFPVPGIYTFWFGLDGRIEQIGELNVRTPKTDEEHARAAL